MSNLMMFGFALVVVSAIVGLCLFAVLDVAARTADVDDEGDDHVIGLDQYTGERRAALERAQRRRS
jgi:hypothetical protein